MSWGGTSKNKNEKGSLQALTPQNREFLEGIMKQKGLSLRATEDISSSLKRGDGNWIQHLNTGVSSFQKAKSSKQPLIRAPIVGRHTGSGSVANSSSSAPSLVNPEIRQAEQLVLQRFSGKKMLPEIIRDSPPVRDMYVGGAPVPDREFAKDRLGQVMEHGSDFVKRLEARAMEMCSAGYQQEQRRKAGEERQKGSGSSMNPKDQMIDQIVDEIRERREFLEAMRAAGKGAEYEEKIKSEMLIRIHELEKLGLKD